MMRVPTDTKSRTAEKQPANTGQHTCRTKKGGQRVSSSAAPILLTTGVKIDCYHTFHLSTGGVKDFTNCIIMLHELAPKFHVARAACEELWSRGTFRCEWHPWSEIMTDAKAQPGLNLFCERLRTSIALRNPN